MSANEAPGATTSAPTPSAPRLGRITLAATIERYMRGYAGLDRTRGYQLELWSSLLGERWLDELTDDHVFHALEQLRTEPALVYVGKSSDGAPIHRGKRTRRSAATVNRYRSALMAVCTWSIKQRLAPKGWENPCRKVEALPEKDGVVRFLSDAERARLLAACRESSWPRLYLIVLLAITTGARRGELLSLTWGRIELERAIAYVPTSKNGQPRALPLVPIVLEELKRFASDRAEALLFPGKSRTSSPRHFENAWWHALERAEIKGFRFHDLRHTCASYLAQNGASLLEIADVMGHRQLAMVKRYAHLTTDTKAKLVNRVLGAIR